MNTKRKRLFNSAMKVFLLTLICSISAFISAYAYNDVDGLDSFEVSKNDEKVWIYNSSEITTSDGCNLHIACYDNDILISVKTVNITESNYTMPSQTITLPYNAKSLTVKVFAWERTNSLVPLCDPVTVYSQVGYVSDNGMVVATGSSYTATENNSTVYKLPILANDGEEDTLTSISPTVFDGISEGDAFVYSVAKGNIVDEVCKIVSDLSGKTYKEMLDLCGDLTSQVKNTTGDFVGEYNNDLKFILAPVYNKSSNFIKLVTKFDENYLTNLDRYSTDYTYANDIKCYSFDDTNLENSKTNAIYSENVMKSIFIKNATDSNDITNLLYSGNSLAFALIRVSDDDVQEVYSIVLD